MENEKRDLTALEKKWEQEEKQKTVNLETAKDENLVPMIDQKTGELRKYTFILSVYAQAVEGYYPFVKGVVEQAIPELNKLVIFAENEKGQFPVNFKYVAEEIKGSKENKELVVISENNINKLLVDLLRENNIVEVDKKINPDQFREERKLLRTIKLSQKVFEKRKGELHSYSTKGAEDLNNERKIFHECFSETIDNILSYLEKIDEAEKDE